ncbi:MAG: histidinol-phosphatase [Planctomycetota bacterium]
MRRLIFAGLSLVLLAAAWHFTANAKQVEGRAPQWLRGNTHTHTLWSDGNGAPEWVASWYVENGYDFLVLTDHNILSTGERWFPIKDEGRSRLTSERVQQIEDKFGEGWVEVRGEDDGQPKMRLKTLTELRERFENETFFFIQGEEITSDFQGAPIHVNGVNLTELIPKQTGASLREVLQNAIDAVIAQSESAGRPMFAHVNHPNFGWAMTPEDIAHIRGERFFEVYNGHSGVRNYGDAEHASMEQLWDMALTLRLTTLDLGLLYGVATDDSHEYFETGLGKTNPGRGWVMVWSESRDPDTVVTAMREGEFYASSGVSLTKVHATPKSLEVAIDAEEGVTYTTRFIGTRGLSGGAGPLGEILAETTANPAKYTFDGDELYVRATVTSSKKHPNPYAKDDPEMAWVQPVVPGKAAERTLGK